MFKGHPKLEKLWNKMEKEASIKLSESTITFDKRKKVTKEFTKNLCGVVTEGFKKLDKKRLKRLLDFSGINVKGR